MTAGRASAASTTFETGLLPSGLAAPALLSIFSLVAFASDAVPVGLGLGCAGIALMPLFLWSRLRIDSNGSICVRSYSIRTKCLPVNEIRWIYAEYSEYFPTTAPAVRVEAADGRRVTLRLGQWRRESELLARLETLSTRIGARTDKQVRQLFHRRPPGAFWERRLWKRGPRARPFTRTRVERMAFRGGLMTSLLGLSLVIVADQTRPGLGALGMVPEAVVGLNAIVLGLLAILTARPRRELKRIAGSVWVPLGAAVVVTVATMVIALAEFAPVLSVDRRIAVIFLALGLGIGVFTFSLGSLALILRIAGAARRRIVGDRWV